MGEVLSIDDMLSGKKSKYALAVAVAKRAREITDEKCMRGEIIDEKPVNMAVREFKEHKYDIVGPDCDV